MSAHSQVCACIITYVIQTQYVRNKMYACASVLTHAHTHVYTYFCVLAPPRVYTYVCARVRECVRACVRACARARVCVCVYLHMHALAYVRMFLHTNACTQVRNYVCAYVHM